MRSHEQLTIHCLVRDEMPTVVFALLSTLPAAAKAIVVDTGSTDGTREHLEKIRDMYPDKVDLHFRDDIPDSTNWSFQRWNPPNKKLSAVRKWMMEVTETKYFWVVDGDEVYRDETLPQIHEILDNWPVGKSVVYLPLLWFAEDVHTIGNFDPSSYPVTGRLFLNEGLEIHGAFPGEVHTYGTQDLGPGSPRADIAHWVTPFHHYEVTTKPWRRRTLSTVPYAGPQPEVFERYGRTEQSGRESTGRDSDDGPRRRGTGRRVGNVPQRAMGAG